MLKFSERAGKVNYVVAWTEDRLFFFPEMTKAENQLELPLGKGPGNFLVQSFAGFEEFGSVLQVSAAIFFQQSVSWEYY